MKEPSMPNPEKEKNPEKGTNVEIVLKVMRHGERTKEGKLEDHGREITREKARESGIQQGDFNAVKAIGSSVQPGIEVPIKDGVRNMGRAQETAHIYADEIEGDEKFQTRINDLLSYEGNVIPDPYDHKAVYNSYLPEDFENLPPEEKVKAAKTAQRETVNYAFSLDGEDVDTWKKEVAGAFAELVRHYIKVAGRLKAGSRVLIPAGTHSPTMEMLLHKALVKKSTYAKVGIDSLDEIGGEFDPSDAYNVFINTDEDGKLEEVRLTFDRSDRPQEEMILDGETLEELADFYEELHPRSKYERESE